MRDRLGSERRHYRSDDLAAELLDVVNESELRRFLGRLAAETARASGRPIPRDTVRALLPILRRTAERTLPTLTIAVGDEHAGRCNRAHRPDGGPRLRPGARRHERRGP